MTTRIPSVARQVLADHEVVYPAEIKRRVQVVHDDLFENRPLTPLETTAPDQHDWQQASRAHLGTPWLDAPWYFAEALFYRKLIEATGYFGRDSWAGRDPFLPRKTEELAGQTAWAVLISALSASNEDSSASLRALLHFAVWGNRVDLSYMQISQQSGTHIALEQERENLLVDDTVAVVDHLAQGREETNRPGGPIWGPVRVDFILDNAGTELLTDLALVDELLQAGWVEQVMLHVKAHPTYVSDTTAADVELTLTAMKARPEAEIVALAERLVLARTQHRLFVRPDFFWTSSHFFWKLPPPITVELAQARLVIVKGDANYRRLVGDSRWPTTVPATEAIPYFPAPLVALRTLKSDPIVGLPPGLAEQLDAEDGEWRVNGKRGLIQAILTVEP